jgi:autotransporter-associated beta strand protein
MDEVRIGTSWADVTPIGCSPGAVFNVTGGGAACSGSGFPVGLSGSEIGVDYYLVNNGVLSGQFVSGSGGALDFSTQTTSGQYTVFASNTTSSCMGWMAGSASLSNLQPPGIAAQPASVTVTPGGTATISVSATGDGLTYQWRKNGANLADGTKYSGSSSANLTISSAASGDQATTSDGYDVVITGTCSPAVTSTKAGLTLQAPADLLWFGTNPGNLWDVNTSANFSGSVFNYGDNVTFDDSTAVISVNLVSSFLSPSKITVNASSQNYSFTGPGALIGPGVLYNVGAGTLTLGAVNSMTGGIVISNGIVSFANSLYLGAGPITLAGGSLSSANVQGIACNNPINVVSDSSIIINNTSTSALILTNSIGGPSGTLTFTNGTLGRGPVVRLIGAGFTNSRPIVLNLGPNAGDTNTSSTNLFLNFANTSADQVFNAPISGGGTIQRSANGGTTLLNALNTYTNETQISGGTLLVNGQIDVAPVTVSGGTLGGAGTILGPVTVTNATLAPGNRGIGTLTINNSLTLQSNSTNVFEISKTPKTNDVVRGVTSLTYGGTLLVTNLAGTLVAGDTFTLFNASSSSGNFSAVTGSAGPGLGFSFNPANGVLSVVTTVALNRTNITYSVNGSNLTLSWPADHIGWILQGQTNGPNGGLGTNWAPVAGSASTNSVVVPINRANGSAFYRLVSP